MNFQGISVLTVRGMDRDQFVYEGCDRGCDLISDDGLVCGLGRTARQTSLNHLSWGQRNIVNQVCRPVGQGKLMFCFRVITMVGTFQV